MNTLEFCCARLFGLLPVVLVLSSVSGASARAQSDLQRAYRAIASKTFIDLTHSFDANTPVWSGFGQAKMTPALSPETHEPYMIAKDGFRATFYEMVGQYGTTSIRPRFLPRTASPWIGLHSSR